jgi:TorA maturation chaperone TorD
MFEYKIKSLDVNNNEIVAVWLTVSKTEQPEQNFTYAVALEQNVQDQNFIPYQEASEVLVLRWAKEKIVQAEVEAQYSRLYSMQTNSVMPWSN